MHALLIPESNSSDATHGVVGSEGELAFEYTGATGEPCDCIIDHTMVRMSLQQSMNMNLRIQMCYKYHTQKQNQVTKPQR